MTPSDKKIDINIKSDTANLEGVRHKVDDFVTEAGYDDVTAGLIVLSIDEALTNIIRHAYKGQADKPIDIQLKTEDNQLFIKIRDFGCPAPAEKIKSRDLDDIRPGGLGVHIMKECMDHVAFIPSDDGCGTLLSMDKKLP